MALIDMEKTSVGIGAGLALVAFAAVATLSACSHPLLVSDTMTAQVSGTRIAPPTEESMCKAVRFERQSGLMGLRWLKAVQNEDGSWPENKIAMTAMALCAFMAEGHRPGDSDEFSDTMVKGVNFLLAHQQEDGLFDIRDPENFSHPIATWSLFTLYGKTLNPHVRNAAEKALKPILASQSATGGWAPALKQGDDDAAYTFWCLEALHAAKAADIPRIHEELDVAIARASDAFKWLDHLRPDNCTPSWDGPTPEARQRRKSKRRDSPPMLNSTPPNSTSLESSGFYGSPTVNPISSGFDPPWRSTPPPNSSRRRMRRRALHVHAAPYIRTAPARN